MYNRYVCEHCGANLDPNEHCDCQEDRKKREEKLLSFFSYDVDGQMIFKEAAS